jgi:hypothetical protein
LNLASEHSSTGRFANRIAKSDDLLSSALQSTSSRRETRVSWMGEIIVSLDGYFCFPGRNFDWKHAGVSRLIPQRGDPAAWRQRRSARISCSGNDHCPTRFAAQTLATTVKRFGAAIIRPQSTRKAQMKTILMLIVGLMLTGCGSTGNHVRNRDAVDRNRYMVEHNAVDTICACP